MTQREKILRQLLEFNAPLEGTYSLLRQFPWDSEQELVTLRKQHIASILERYTQSSLTEAEVEAWANAIEGRDDLGLEPGQEELLCLMLRFTLRSESV